MKTLDSIFWAGTEQSLEKLLSSEKQDISAYQPSQAEVAEAPRLFTQMGGVGVITINGPLVNTDSWMNSVLGRTSYGDIREAMVHAASDPSVKAILLDINSGGGAVSGVSDAANLIKKIDKEVKPVHTFSDGQLASAAYWLGSSARTVNVGQVAEAGSIGVITVHKEMSKSLEMEGIKATVIKAGENKGAGNPYEPLSDKAKAEIQGQLDHLYGIFVQQVADNRGVNYQVADSKMAQGRVFIGTQAVDAGLADSVTSFDALLSKITRGIDSEKNSSQYGGNFSKGPAMKVALTEQQIAVMAAVMAEGGGLTAVAQAALESVETPTTAPAVEAPAAPAAEAPVAAQPEVKSESPELVAFLKTSLAETQAANTTLTIELRDLKAAGEKITTSHAALRSIAEASVDRLKVALGGTAGGVSALSDESLLAEHASLRAQFEGKFKAGGVAAVSSSGSAEKVGEVHDPVRLARIAATRLA